MDTLLTIAAILYDEAKKNLTPVGLRRGNDNPEPEEEQIIEEALRLARLFKTVYEKQKSFEG